MAKISTIGCVIVLAALTFCMLSFCGFCAADDVIISWDAYETRVGESPIDGFRLYWRGEKIMDSIPPNDQQVETQVFGETGNFTMTAFRGQDESVHSSPPCVYTPTESFTLRPPTNLSIVPGTGEIISRENWSIKYVDSEETAREDAPATAIFDGNATTHWHTEWSAAVVTAHPHEVQIDLGEVYEISGLRYLPRQNSENGRVANYEIYASLDGESWDEPVFTGIFPNDAAVQELFCSPTLGRFIRFIALSEVNGYDWTTIAEINIRGEKQS